MSRLLIASGSFGASNHSTRTFWRKETQAKQEKKQKSQKKQ